MIQIHPSPELQRTLQLEDVLAHNPKAVPYYAHIVTANSFLALLLVDPNTNYVMCGRCDDDELATLGEDAKAFLSPFVVDAVQKEKIDADETTLHILTQSILGDSSFHDPKSSDGKISARITEAADAIQQILDHHVGTDDALDEKLNEFLSDINHGAPHKDFAAFWMYTLNELLKAHAQHLLATSEQQVVLNTALLDDLRDTLDDLYAMTLGFITSVITSPRFVDPEIWTLAIIHDLDDDVKERARSLSLNVHKHFSELINSNNFDSINNLLTSTPKFAEDVAKGYVVGMLRFARVAWTDLVKRQTQFVSPVISLTSARGTLSHATVKSMATENLTKTLLAIHKRWEPLRMASIGAYKEGQDSRSITNSSMKSDFAQMQLSQIPTSARSTNAKSAVPMNQATNRSAVKNVVQNAVKIGRNDPCPCGSGKKYKKCCGA